MKRLLLFCLIIFLTGCTSYFKIVERDPNTGYFPISQTFTVAGKSTIVEDVPFDLDSNKQLILVPEDDFGFIEQMVKNIKYFDEVITFDELENRIIKAGLQDKITSVRERLGIHNAYKNYKPFLWFHIEEEVREVRGDIFSTESPTWTQFVLTNPTDLKDLFICEVNIDWDKRNDQNTWYPLFNNFIRYIEKNSKVYQ